MITNIAFVVIMVCISPLTTEIFAPAMTSAAKSFNFTIVELSMSVYFLVILSLNTENSGSLCMV